MQALFHEFSPTRFQMPIDGEAEVAVIPASGIEDAATKPVFPASHKNPKDSVDMGARNSKYL
jgi:hypothetical protein